MTPGSTVTQMSVFALLHKPAHCRLCFADSRSPLRIRNVCQLERIPQNSSIGVAMRRYSIKIERTAGERFERLAECEVVDCIGAMQERPIDIE